MRMAKVIVAGCLAVLVIFWSQGGTAGQNSEVIYGREWCSSASFEERYSFVTGYSDCYTYEYSHDYLAVIDQFDTY